MTDDIQSMEVSGYICTLTSAGLVGIESCRNIYVPTLSLAHGLAITPLRSSFLAYALPGSVALPETLLSAFLAVLQVLILLPTNLLISLIPPLTYT